jgi:hypothetical protein
LHSPPATSINPAKDFPVHYRGPAHAGAATEVHVTMTANDKSDLKLIALDIEDLDVVSAHLQDAVISVGEMTYLKRERRFAAIANRFDWSQALANARRRGEPFTRRRTGLRFEHVLGAQLTGIDLDNKRQMLNVLAIRFEPATAPEGFVTIACAGNAAIRLHVECLEAELKDLGAAWATKSKPEHPDDDTGSSGS